MKSLGKDEGEERENPNPQYHHTLLITTNHALLGAQPTGGEPHLPNTQ